MVFGGFTDTNFIIPWFLFVHKKNPVGAYQDFQNPYFLAFRLQ